MKEAFLERLRPTLTSIAGIAIVWNVIKTFFDNMENSNTAMFLLIGITGVAVLLLPDILKKLWQFYAIISTGISIIAVNLIGYKHIPLMIIISLVTILVDALVMNYIDVSTIIIDVILSIICAFTICFFSTDIISLLFLLPMYVIIFTFKTNFGIKKPYKKDKTEEENKNEKKSESENEESGKSENEEEKLDNIDGIAYVDDADDADDE